MSLMSEADRLIDQFKRAHDGDPWHGSPVKAILEGRHRTSRRRASAQRRALHLGARAAHDRLAQRSRAARDGKARRRAGRRRLAGCRRADAGAMEGGAGRARRLARSNLVKVVRGMLGRPPAEADQRSAQPPARHRRQLLRAAPRHRPARRLSRRADRHPEESSRVLGFYGSKVLRFRLTGQARRHADARHRLRRDVVVRRRDAIVFADGDRHGLPADLPFLFSPGQRFGPLPDRPSARQGRDGPGLRGRGDRERPARRDEDPQPRARRRRRARAVPARGTAGRVAQPSEQRLRLRHQRGPGLSRHRDGAGARRAR